MLVILANRWDDSANELASLWKSQDARVMTPRDLSRPGWCQRLGRSDGNTVVLGDDVIPQEEISAVLTRLPLVFVEELNYIEEADRSFVASEMNAFLTFWLSSLSCPVVNRPSLGCLNGPALNQKRWMQAATRAGLSLAPDPPGTEPDPETVTSIIVVGGRSQADEDPRLREQACNLAQSMQVDLIAVRFAGTHFLDVDLLPQLGDQELSNAVLELLAGTR